MVSSVAFTVRKHRAPKGALRLNVIADGDHEVGGCVRKHRAPKGALRRALEGGHVCVPFGRQKAPSAKRCIKTDRVYVRLVLATVTQSESTERQKVH